VLSEFKKPEGKGSSPKDVRANDLIEANAVMKLPKASMDLSIVKKLTRIMSLYVQSEDEAAQVLCLLMSPVSDDTALKTSTDPLCASNVRLSNSHTCQKASQHQQLRAC
jgi:hypothetical protein